MRILPPLIFSRAKEDAEGVEEIGPGTILTAAPELARKNMPDMWSFT